MTAKECYEAILIEINRTDTPNILLEEFNYLFNKAINQYVNKSYNKYDINQQATDDLRVLKATSLLTPGKCSEYGDLSTIGRMMGATYEVILPQDYLHLLNCICIFKVKKTIKCYNKGDVWRRPAERLTADKYSQVMDNMWLKPTYKRPYYYIHNVNQGVDRLIQPTDPIRQWSPGNFEEIPFQFYVGVEEPTSNNYRSLLNYRMLRNQDFTMPEDTYLYIMVPYNNTKLEVKGSETDFLINIKQDKIINNAYIVYKSVQTISRTVVITADGGKAGKELSIEGSRMKIGTDFAEGGLSSEYSNREVSEDGLPSTFGTDGYGNQIVAVKPGEGVPTSMYLNFGGKVYNKASTVERAAQVRYGNASQVRMEIRYGTDDSVFELSRVYIDYIKAPQHIRLTQEQLDLTEDTSQKLEFPDYVCQEIVNELTHLIMENTANQRLTTHPVVSQSIANPTQQQQQAPAQQD